MVEKLGYLIARRSHVEIFLAKILHRDKFGNDSST